jgi:hypothetical protein
VNGTSISNFKKVTALVIAGCLTIHILIALSLTFFSHHFTTGSSKVGKLYEYLVHLGPFYREETIKSSPHFIVSANGETLDVIEKHASQFQYNVLKVHELTLRDHTRRAADAFLNSTNKNSSAGFRKLYQITEREFQNIKVGDDVSWYYILRWYHPKENTFSNDTLFVHHFTWSQE